jgi:2-polyprenyl-3-methyl-5-hydroxy-6-metoxy-1,4-benzoquinol methylase
MPTKTDYKQIEKDQCERTAEIYYHFRKKGGTANDLIEIPAMKRLIGNVEGKKVLDAGCGFGYYSIYCAKQGAKVTGIDISKTMIALSKKEAFEAEVDIDFRVMDSTDMKELTSGTFDMVISSIAISFEVPQFFKEVSRVLKPGGVFCFSEVHPIIDAGHKVGEGADAYRVVERYFDTSIRKVKNAFGKIHPDDPDYDWQWEPRTIESYCDALRSAGLVIQTIKEPQPDSSLRHVNPMLYQSAGKCPIFLLIRAVKSPLE